MAEPGEDRSTDIKRWIIPVIVLPGTVLVFVPLAIVALTSNTSMAAAPASPASIPFWIGVFFFVPGAFLSCWSMSMFFRFGKGTPAPWDPPRRFVVCGPYRHVRNPMISGVIALLIAMALLLQSWPIGVWAALFFLANTFYFRNFEEPGLQKRFGEDYRLYCRNVGRWLPRLRPWDLPA